MTDRTRVSMDTACVSMNTASVSTNTACVLPYDGVSPVIGEPVRFLDRNCAVLGRARIGRDAAFAAFAVVRADGHVVNAGDDFFLGAHATVHISHALYGSTVGDRVTVGRNSIVHACTIGDDCVLDDDVAVLDGAAVGRGSVLAAGSVVYPRSALPPGYWCEGSPAKPIRLLEAGEREAMRERVRATARVCETVSTRAFECVFADGAAGERAGSNHAGGAFGSFGEGVYIAGTVVGRAKLRMAASSSLWFGCVLDAPEHELRIGARSNVQDNSVLRAVHRPIEIAADATIGHNVRLEDCTIGSRTLVGMGSRIAPGTVVHDDVFIAAGTHTTPGQVLASGSLWGGRPARPIAPLGDSLKGVIEHAVSMYREYAGQFAGHERVLAQKQG